MSRISFLVVVTAAGALGAASVIAPFVRTNPASTNDVAPAIIADASAAGPDDTVARGRYLIAIAGCNDCHTPGFITSNGATPEQDWLKGDALGWQGAWGTTYAPNLRRYFQGIDEAGWLAVARKRDFLPPMPTPSIRAMSDDDLRAIRLYSRSLQPVGDAAPPHVPPGRAVAGPVVVFPAPPK